MRGDKPPVVQQGGISDREIFKRIRDRGAEERELGDAFYEDGHDRETLIEHLQRIKLEPVLDEVETVSTSGLTGEAHLEKRSFDCNACGPPDRACNDTTRVDKAFFADPNDGLCLRFLKKTFELFAEEAERLYAAKVNGTRGVIPERILLETHRKQPSARSTLPIDGEFVHANGDDKTTVKVFWPIPRGQLDAKVLDDAILSLPYLAFHEVFVHGPQGAALQADRFAVHDGCHFTEGAVDVVAFRTLVDDVLMNYAALPPILSKLSDRFVTFAEAYNTERFDESALYDGAMDEEAGVRIARTFGRIHIYNTLKRIGKTLRPEIDDWAERIILMLNLLMTEKERERFYYLMWTAHDRSDLNVHLVDDFDRFLEQGDVAWLIDRLNCQLETKF